MFRPGKEVEEVSDLEGQDMIAEEGEVGAEVEVEAEVQDGAVGTGHCEVK